MRLRFSIRPFRLSRLEDVWPLPANETVILGFFVIFHLGIVIGWIGDDLTKGGIW